ncbi:hypothetical protein [Pelagibaculum spongiae]|nr:hypothetical protein [Pelagibaculum spongiae]
MSDLITEALAEGILSNESMQMPARAAQELLSEDSVSNKDNQDSAEKNAA